jgi:excisionase family DNA binding protein
MAACRNQIPLKSGAEVPIPSLMAVIDSAFGNHVYVTGSGSRAACDCQECGPAPRQWLTTEEAARRLQISQSHLIRLVRSGYIYRQQPGVHRWTEDEIRSVGEQIGKAQARNLPARTKAPSAVESARPGWVRFDHRSKPLWVRAEDAAGYAKRHRVKPASGSSRPRRSLRSRLCSMQIHSFRELSTEDHYAPGIGEMVQVSAQACVCGAEREVIRRYWMLGTKTVSIRRVPPGTFAIEGTVVEDDLPAPKDKTSLQPMAESVERGVEKAREAAQKQTQMEMYRQIKRAKIDQARAEKQALEAMIEAEARAKKAETAAAALQPELKSPQGRYTVWKI